MADYKPKQFFGTAQTVFNYTSADITAGNFSPAGTDFDNTTDGSVPYADRAMCMLECDYASAPTAATRTPARKRSANWWTAAAGSAPLTFSMP